MVTIIVLLILAMVSVSLVIRGNIIEKANLAVTEYGKAAEQENTDLDKLEGEISKYIPGGINQKNAEYYLTLAKKMCGIIEVKPGEYDDLEKEVKEVLRYAYGGKPDKFNSIYGYDGKYRVVYWYSVDGYEIFVGEDNDGNYQVDLLNNENGEIEALKRMANTTKEIENKLKEVFIDSEYTFTGQEELENALKNQLSSYGEVNLNVDSLRTDTIEFNIENIHNDILNASDYFYMDSTKIGDTYKITNVYYQIH